MSVSLQKATLNQQSWQAEINFSISKSPGLWSFPFIREICCGFLEDLPYLEVPKPRLTNTYKTLSIELPLQFQQ